MTSEWVERATAPQPSQQVLVVPARVDRAQAQATLERWVRGRRFARRAFREAPLELPGRPAHLPVWSVTTTLTTDYEGRRGEHHWRTRFTQQLTADNGYRTVPEQVRETDWSQVSGRVTRRVVGEQVVASRRWDPSGVDDLGPWPLDGAAPQPGVPASADAAPTELSEDDAATVAVRRRREDVLGDVREDIGGDDQDVRDVRTVRSGTTADLVLVPLWVAVVVTAGTPYEVVLDAVSGRVVGERRPWSPVAVGGAVLGLLAAATVAVVVARLLLG